MNNYSTTSIPIYTESGQVVATVEDGALVKRVFASRHMLKQPKGWAMDDICIQQAESTGANRIQIFDVESKSVYETSIEKFWRLGIPVNRRYGKQTCLPLTYWKRTDNNAARQLSWL
jgi:hypothetical protein